jgi:pantoate--beta-alanine ligase
VSRALVVTDLSALREQRQAWLRDGLSVGFAPTMGNLHEGHIDLVRAAAERADRVVVSIFVNPLQFGPGEDFAAYPRTLAEDLERLEAEPCHLVFAPDEATMYPRGRANATRVEVPGLSAMLCGAARPGHFTGVATVVARLFNLVQPRWAVFGQKDYQQLAIIRQMTADLGFPVEIVGIPTRREADGLAMSSRNRYLGPAERRRAPALYAALCSVARALSDGDGNLVALQQAGVENIRSAGFEPEYLEVRRQGDLGEPSPSDRDLVVLAAARLGRARLIDNVSVRLGG